MDQQESAFYFFRKLVYVLYLEVGGLQPRIHPELAGKAYLKTAFFEREKERQAAELYRQTEAETDTETILAPYKERTGLSLDDVERVFREGDWKNKFSGFTTGGPRLARIAQVTIQLKSLIDQEDWQGAADLIYEIKKLKTNQTYVVNVFERSERRY
jgi:hypothetical protein